MRERIENFFKCLKMLPVLSEYLENGWYVYRENSFKKIKKIRLVRFPLFYIRSSAKKKKATYDFCSIHLGGWSRKNVVLFEDKVLSVYKHKDTKKWFSNIRKYLGETTYPACRYLEIDEKKGRAVCSKEPGKLVPNTYESIVFFAKEVLKCNLTAKKYLEHEYSPEIQKRFDLFGIRDVVSYVQHGDCGWRNIMVDAGGDYKFIDFDTIDIFPAFYDLFRLLLDLENGLPLYFNGFFDEELSAVLATCGIALTIEQKDKYFAAFCLFVEEWTRRIPRNQVPEEYRFTQKVLKEVDFQK